MSARKIIMSGTRYGMLTVLSEVVPHIYPRKFHCQCDCGNRVIVKLTNLLTGNTKACGCQKKGHTTHGYSTDKTSTYRVWKNMRNRCLNANNPAYKHYGGRGITVCERWNSFENFLEDMGARPSGLTLDRLNNNGSYCKENCAWRDWFAQANNRRNNRRVRG